MRLAVLIVLASSLTLTAAASPPPSRAPLPVKTDPALLEQSPAVSGGYLAWGQSSRTTLHFDLIVQAGNGQPFRVNPRGPQARPGGISGRTLAYQEWRGRHSDVRLFNLASRKRVHLPRGANTPNWESRPSLSGRWLLFNRQSLRTKLEVVLLHNLRTGRQIVLDRARPPEHVFAQQLAGKYAVWTHCRFRCFVVRYDRANGTRIHLSSSGIPEDSDFAASVLPNGTIYFVRGTMFCDPAVEQRVLLLRYSSATGTERIADLEGTPAALFATTEGGTPVVYFDRGPCRGEDIYRIFDSPPPPPVP